MESDSFVLQSRCLVGGRAYLRTPLCQPVREWTHPGP